MQQRSFIVAFVLCAFAWSAFGALLQEDGERADGFDFSSKSMDGTEMQYAVWVSPALEGEAGPHPAIVFLHGSGECGTDGRKQTTVGLPRWLEAEPERWPFVVVIPQKPARDKQWEDYAELVFAILDDTSEQYSIDADRVALTGLSQGGHGSWSIGAAAPERFQCVAPICAYSDWSRRGSFDDSGEFVQGVVEALGAKPVWMFHGDSDRAVSVQESRGMARALAGTCDELRLTIYPGVGHNSWDAAYRDPELQEWFVRHTNP